MNNQSSLEISESTRQIMRLYFKLTMLSAGRINNLELTEKSLELSGKEAALLFAKLVSPFAIYLLPLLEPSAAVDLANPATLARNTEFVLGELRKSGLTVLEDEEPCVHELVKMHSEGKSLVRIWHRRNNNYFEVIEYSCMKEGLGLIFSNSTILAIHTERLLGRFSTAEEAVDFTHEYIEQKRGEVNHGEN